MSLFTETEEKKQTDIAEMLLSKEDRLTGRERVNIAASLCLLFRTDLPRYEQHGVHFLMRQVKDEELSDIRVDDNSYPYLLIDLTENMSIKLIEQIEHPKQIKALNIALGEHASKSFIKKFEEELNNDIDNTLLWFQNLALVSNVRYKNLSPLEKKFIIPQQIRIAKNTVARMKEKEERSRS